jgi:hypothetical protein
MNTLVNGLISQWYSNLLTTWKAWGVVAAWLRVFGVRSDPGMVRFEPMSRWTGPNDGPEHPQGAGELR